MSRSRWGCRYWLPVAVTTLLLTALVGLPGSAAGGAGTLRVGISADIQLMDPHLSWVVVDRYVNYNVYEGLVGLDRRLNPVPGLAVRWSEESPTSYVFELRPDVYFHNGKPLTADDVKYSVERVLDPKLGSRLRSDFGIIEGVDVLGPLKVRLRLKAPFSALIGYLPNLAIVPKGSGEELKSHPVGTGPFRFVRRVANEQVELERFDRYWDRAVPHLDRIILMPIPDPTIRLANLQTGRIDLVDTVPPAQLGQLRRMADVIVYTRDASTTYDYFAFNLKRPLLQNKKLRQAMAWALDKEAIRLAVMEGAASVSTVPFPPTHWAYSLPVNAYGYDLERARQLLAEAGYPKGGVTVKVTVSPSYPEQVKMAQIWQAGLAQIGVNLQLESLEWGAWLDKVVRQRDYDIFISYSSSLAWDPDAWLYYLYQSEGSLNINHYNNPRIDELLLKGRTTSDPEARKAIYSDIQKILVDEVPRVIIQHRQLISASTRAVKGFYLNERGDLLFKDVSLER